MKIKRLLIPKETAEKIDYLLTHEPESDEECLQDDWLLAVVEFGGGFTAEVVLETTQYFENQDNKPLVVITTYCEGQERACSGASELWGIWDLSSNLRLVIEKGDVEEITVV